MAEYCKGDQPAPESCVNIHPSNDVKPIPKGYVDNHIFKGDEIASVGNNCKEIVLQIKSDMDKLSLEPSNPSIYRIPKALRETNEKAYTPVRVAIGPYHADNVALKPMEEHKLRYLKALISRSTSGADGCSDEASKLEEYFEAIARKEPDARRCYDGIINLSPDSFTRMLLIDGASILELSYRKLDNYSHRGHDPILACEKVTHEVCRDLILLENQIPYSILECLFELTSKYYTARIEDRIIATLDEILVFNLRYTIPISGIEGLNIEKMRKRLVERRRLERCDKFLHLVDLLRSCCLLRPPQWAAASEDPQREEVQMRLLERRRLPPSPPKPSAESADPRWAAASKGPLGVAVRMSSERRRFPPSPPKPSAETADPRRAAASKGPLGIYVLKSSERRRFLSSPPKPSADSADPRRAAASEDPQREEVRKRLPASISEDPRRAAASEDSRTSVSYSRPLTATKLHEAGIQFKQQAIDQPSLHTDFAKGTVEMPCIRVDDNTETLFRNIMAFEQYHLDVPDVTDFMSVLDGLIDTVKDVEILEKSKVLIPSLESNDNVTTLFNSITHQTTFSRRYSEVCTQLNDHARRPWNKWKATLHRDYFGSPWSIISLIAAIILLILTVIQTVLSAK